MASKAPTRPSPASLSAASLEAAESPGCWGAAQAPGGDIPQMRQGNGRFKRKIWDKLGKYGINLENLGDIYVKIYGIIGYFTWIQVENHG